MGRMSWTEFLGFVTGALSVWLFVRERVAAWPVGIANSALWLVLFWQSKLYLDSGLQAVYIVLGFLGWYWWVHGRTPDTELPVTHTPRIEAGVLAALAVLSTAGLWYTQATWTDSALPFWDSATTVVSLIAQYMLMRKLYENWWLWIAVDVAYVGMYVSQGLLLTAALQPVFIILCIQGLRTWRAQAPAGTPASAGVLP